MKHNAVQFNYKSRKGAKGKLSTKLWENETIGEIKVLSLQRKQQIHVMGTKCYRPLY